MDQQSKLYVKGMVCNRCVMVVNETLKDLGYISNHVVLGEITLNEPGHPFNLKEIEERLAIHGFSFVEDRDTKIVMEIKALVSEVYGGDYDFPEKFLFSNLMHERLQSSYESARDLFISRELMSLEKYIIEYRTNKVKEFLVYSDLTLADIAFKLNYSSVAYLSSHFKKITGLTPSFFRRLKTKKGDLSFPKD